MKNRVTVLKFLLVVLTLLGSTAASGAAATDARTNGDRLSVASLNTETGYSPGTAISANGTTNIAADFVARHTWIESLPASPAALAFAAGLVGLVTVGRRTKN